MEELRSALTIRKQRLRNDYLVQRALNSDNQPEGFILSLEELEAIHPLLSNATKSKVRPTFNTRKKSYCS